MSEAQEDKSQISDGYHTFAELYEHRHALYITLCRILNSEGLCEVWRSRKHHDGPAFDGWFILGINYDKGNQITYHIPDHLWSRTEFAETLDRPPEWDTHTSQDVIDRLYSL